VHVLLLFFFLLIQRDGISDRPIIVEMMASLSTLQSLQFRARSKSRGEWRFIVLVAIFARLQARKNRHQNETSAAGARIDNKKRLLNDLAEKAQALDLECALRYMIYAETM
jgi:hypothetical protein